MTDRNRHRALILALFIIVGAIGYLEYRKPHLPVSSTGDIVVPAPTNADAAARAAEKAQRYDRARELVSPSGYINTGPIKIADLIGKKVILVDFWTYSCINCQRTLPYLNSWYAKYADQGLEIIGVHTPEFDFEKNYDNVKRATEKYGVRYSVVMDNDSATWTAYGNRYWPHKYLIDIDGFIVYDHVGEGSYNQTEDEIVRLLDERSRVLGLAAVRKNDVAPVGVQTFNAMEIGTPETYLGYDRQTGLINGYDQACLDVACDYVLPEKIPSNKFAFGGRWQAGPQAVRLVSGAGTLTLRFRASKANLVAGAVADGAKVRAEILLDGRPITDQQAGSAVRGGVAEFSVHDLYYLVDLHGDYGEHLLQINFLEPGVEVFAFTFG